jgi:transposase
MGLARLRGTLGETWAGRKSSWTEADMVFLEECLEQEPRTYNSVQLAQKLEQERSVKLSPDWLRQVLKKRGSNGFELEKAIKENKI